MARACWSSPAPAQLCARKESPRFAQMPRRRWDRAQHGARRRPLRLINEHRASAQARPCRWSTGAAVIVAAPPPDCRRGDSFDLAEALTGNAWLVVGNLISIDISIDEMRAVGDKRRWHAFRRLWPPSVLSDAVGLTALCHTFIGTQSGKRGRIPNWDQIPQRFGPGGVVVSVCGKGGAVLLRRCWASSPKVIPAVGSSSG